MTGKDQVTHPVLEVFRDHNAKMKTLIGSDYAKATHTRYKACYKHLKKFIVSEHKDEGYPISKVDVGFIEDFEHYMKTKKPQSCSHNTTMKYLSHFKKIVNIALKRGWLKEDPFDDYNKSYRKKDPLFLSFDELKRLEETDLENESLDRVRDVFLFSCYTGLSYSDAKKLSERDIKRDQKGDYYLHLHRTKTGESMTVLLLPEAAGILTKYEDHPATPNGELLPVISNQKTNAYLKVLVFNL